MVKVVANDGMNIRETISNKIEIAGPVHWLSWISSEQVIPGDHVMVEIESRSNTNIRLCILYQQPVLETSKSKTNNLRRRVANTVFTTSILRKLREWNKQDFTRS